MDADLVRDALNAASTGPRSNERGDPPSEAGHGAFAGLASTGPRSNERGDWGCREAGVLPARTASTGPRSNERGDKFVYAFDLGTRAGFNGAALKRARRWFTQ